jgi:hypothetical protein
MDSSASISNKPASLNPESKPFRPNKPHNRRFRPKKPKPQQSAEASSKLEPAAEVPQKPNVNPDAPRKHQGNTYPAKKNSASRYRKKDILGSEQCQILTEKLKKKEVECTICMNPVGVRAKIWCCDQCKQPQHLNCIKKWKESQPNKWYCPVCNFENYGEPKYTCFCGKVEDPEFSPILPPHSCGDTCMKKRAAHCTHPCPLQCHPGQCPPCTSMAPITQCHCGKTKYQILCRENFDVKSCGQKCDKMLNCGEHRCDEVCHAGNCAPCEVRVEKECYCKKETKQVLCGSRGYSCEKECAKTLKCGNHTCKAVCHEAECAECERVPRVVTNCPCGKVPLEEISSKKRETCMDPIPSCGKQCSKKLPCGHLCEEICHENECPPCDKTTSIQCRCGLETMTFKCTDADKPFLCNRRCNTKMSCKRHKCENVCCYARLQPKAEIHRCLAVCGNQLNCKIHSCIQHCHIGNCEACPVVYRERIYCPCGRTFNEPPMRCGTVETEVRCPNKCGKDLPCGHSCVASCHTGECPPCLVLMKRKCNCGSLVKPAQCSVPSISCGRPCGKSKSCGHKCNRKCHGDSCENEVCSMVCGKKRNGCDHVCLMKCHSGVPCPDTPCEIQVKTYCKCGIQFEKTKCSEKREKECDEECERLQRNAKVEKALGAERPLENYSQELVDFASNNVQFLVKLEKTVLAFLNGQKQAHYFPPMKHEFREFIHEYLNNYFNIESQSHDKEPNRSVIIYKTQDTKTPSSLLSSYLSLYNAGQVKPAEQKEAMASLTFYQLQQCDTTADIARALQKWTGDFYIKWVNDHSAAAHFYSLHRCKEARDYLTSLPGPFSVLKFESHVETPVATDFKRRFRNSKKHKHFENMEEDIPENSEKDKKITETQENPIKNKFSELETETEDSSSHIKQDENENPKKNLFSELEEDLISEDLAEAEEKGDCK